MTWPRYVGALLATNTVWLVWAVAVLLAQDKLQFWNWDGPVKTDSELR